MREIGLREWKKRETRKAIAEAALALFAQRGFEAVTVAEVAREAHVSEKTVFNYFPTKEDLVLDPDDDERFIQELGEVIRGCAPGDSIIAAVRTLLVDEFARGLAAGYLNKVEMAARLLDSSPALQARLQARFAKFSAAIAGALAGAAGAAPADIEPWVAANAIIAISLALFEAARRRILAGERGDELRAHARDDAERAWTLIENGIAGYGRCPSP